MLVVHQEKFKYYFYAKLIYYSFLPLGCYNEFWSNWVVFSNPRAPCTANLILLCGKEIKKEYPDIYIRPYYWKTDMTHAIPRFPDWKVLWAHHGNLANEHHCFLKYCGPKSLSHSWKVPVLGGGEGGYSWQVFTQSFQVLHEKFHFWGVFFAKNTCNFDNNFCHTGPNFASQTNQLTLGNRNGSM